MRRVELKRRWYRWHPYTVGQARTTTTLTVTFDTDDIEMTVAALSMEVGRLLYVPSSDSATAKDMTRREYKWVL